MSITYDKSNKGVVKMLLCGDVCVTPATEEYYAKCDIKALFADVLDVFSKADRIVVNLECAITESETSFRMIQDFSTVPSNEYDLPIFKII